MKGLPNSFLTRPLAHRGLHDVKDGRAENSPAAIQAAIPVGYGIEIDVQLSLDGKAMVFHDYHLGRLTSETGAVAQISSDILIQIKLTNCVDNIPTLAQILTQVHGQVPLLIEIKDQDGAMGRNVGALERAVANDLKNYQGDVAVMSFNPNAIASFSSLSPKTPVGLVTDRFLPNDWPTLPAATCLHLHGIPDFDRVNASFISHNHSQLDDLAVLQLKTREIPLLCWTVTSKTQESLARKQADNITFEGYLP